VGILGLVLLVSSWLALFVAGRSTPNWAPNVWLIDLSIGLPGALLAGILAGRLASRWWYSVSAMSVLTAGVMLAGAAV